MTKLKKILLIIFMFFCIYLLKSCVFAVTDDYSVQPFSQDSYSATFDSMYPLYAKSNKMILFPNALVVFKTNVDINNANRFVLFSGTRCRLSDNSEFLVIPVSEVSSSENYSQKFRFLDFNNAFSTTNYNFNMVYWERILFCSVNIYADSFSPNNLYGYGSGIFLGANNFDDINVEYFSRYVQLTSVFATNTSNKTIYFKKSKNTTISNNDIYLKCLGIKDNNTYTIFEYRLSEFDYDNSSDIYYHNLNSTELSVISNNNIEYVQLNSQCWGGRSNEYNFCYLYIPDNSSGGSGGGGSTGGGSTGGNDNINTNAIIESQARTTDSVKESTNAIKEQTEVINDTNNFIKDDTISDDNFVLPNDNINDNTKEGIENIFDLIYTAFTSGTASDIVLPIPFTDKSIVIPSDYLENIFNDNSFSFLLTFIHAFYYFVISSFIIYDIYRKFDKIKSGNIENLQNNNIKADML